METLINFLMGFSTALLPAMLFIAYFLHKNGMEATSNLEQQLHQTASALNESRDAVVKFKKRLVNSEKNNIELTKIQEALRDEIEQLKKVEPDFIGLGETVAPNEAMKPNSGPTPVQEFTLPNNDVSQKPEVAKIENTEAWVEQQLRSVKEKLVTLKPVPKASFPGYVYVLANSQCFGDGQLLIQAARRLEPMDVVRDLSSDPHVFNFEVQMVVFNEDAPNMVRALHERLKDTCSESPIYKIPLFAATVQDVSHALKAVLADKTETPVSTSGPVSAPDQKVSVVSFPEITTSTETVLKNAA